MENNLNKIPVLIGPLIDILLQFNFLDSAHFLIIKDLPFPDTSLLKTRTLIFFF